MPHKRRRVRRLLAFANDDRRIGTRCDFVENVERSRGWPRLAFPDVASPAQRENFFAAIVIKARNMEKRLAVRVTVRPYRVRLAPKDLPCRLLGAPGLGRRDRRCLQLARRLLARPLAKPRRLALSFAKGAVAVGAVVHGARPRRERPLTSTPSI